MKIDFSKVELEFLKESLKYANMYFDSNSSQHFVYQENYGDLYREKKKLFTDVMKKINQQF